MKNSKNKSCKLGNYYTKNCGLNAKFENCIFKDNPNVYPIKAGVADDVDVAVGQHPNYD